MVGAVIGAAVAYVVCTQVGHPAPEPPKPQRNQFSETRHQGRFRYINPLLECDMAEPVLRPQVRKVEKDLKLLLEQYRKSGHITEMSVYYRDLNSGPWMGIGVNAMFSPASLLKVPIMMATLKAVDMDRSLLKRTFKFDATVPMDEFVPNVGGKSLKFGEVYTLVELLEFMIAHSDNNAKNMLFQIVGEDAFDAVWEELGVSFAAELGTEDFLTVKDYSSFFRILYNATYLSKESSELALDILGRTEYDMGIQQGLPDGVILCNKFGERGFMDRDEKQLHDAGIVYAGNSPYLLCVMTRGRSFNAQAKVIAEVSRMVYEMHTATTPIQ
jgi:beta-lactamase class A